MTVDKIVDKKTDTDSLKCFISKNLMFDPRDCLECEAGFRKECIGKYNKETSGCPHCTNPDTIRIKRSLRI